MRKSFNSIAICLWLISIIYLVFNFSAIPQEVPTHYNISGEIDSWGDKTFIFFFPVLGIALWLLLQQIEKRPQFINMPGYNFEQSNTLQRESMMALTGILKNIMLVFFSFMSVVETANSLGHRLNTTPWDIITFTLVIILVVIYYYFKNKKLKTT